VFKDAEVSRPDVERMIDSDQVGVQGVVNDEQVSLAGMGPGVYPPARGLFFFELMRIRLGVEG